MGKFAHTDNGEPDKPESLDSVYQELLGRNADQSGMAYYAGKNLDDVREEIRGSLEFRRKDYAEKLLKAFDRTREWNETYGLDEEFSASEAGDIVFLRAGQNKADYYEYIRTDSDTGLELWIDTGKDTGGLVGTVADAVGIHEIKDMWQEALPNEFKATLGPTAALMAGGTETRRDAADSSGLSREEYQQYGETAEMIAATVVAIIFPVAFWAPAAMKALQHESKRKYGTRQEKENFSWGDAMVDVGTSLATGYYGYKYPGASVYSKSAVAGAGAAVSAYGQGAEFNDAFESGMKAMVFSYLGNRYNLSPETKASMAALYSYSKGGDRRNQNALTSGVAAYSTATAGERFGGKDKEQ